MPDTPPPVATPPLGEADAPVGDRPAELRLLRCSSKPEKVFLTKLIIRGGAPATGEKGLKRITFAVQDLSGKVWYRDTGTLSASTIQYLKEALVQFSKLSTVRNVLNQLATILVITEPLHTQSTTHIQVR